MHRMISFEKGKAFYAFLVWFCPHQSAWYALVLDNREENNARDQTTMNIDLLETTFVKFNIKHANFPIQPVIILHIPVYEVCDYVN